MKTLYQASNAIEAHMIADLLEQQRISARVDGEYLQGALGELPAAGLVKVMVAEEDYAAARAIVDRWDTEQPAQPLTAVPARAAVSARSFAIGMFCGIIVTYGYLR